MRVNQETGVGVSDTQIRAAYPSLSFNRTTDLSSFGFPFLVETDPPVAEEGKQVVIGPNVLDGGVWKRGWVQEEIDVEGVRASARSQVDTKEAEKRQSFPWDFGGEYGVMHLQIRGTEDQANWLTLQNTASAYISAGQGAETELGIRTQENVTVPVTANEAMTIMLAMAGFGGNTMARAWAIKDLIEAATTVAGVQAVLDTELDTGWPIDSMGGQ